MTLAGVVAALEALRSCADDEETGCASCFGHATEALAALRGLTTNEELREAVARAIAAADQRAGWSTVPLPNDVRLADVAIATIAKALGVGS